MDTSPPQLAAHPEASRPYSADARASKAKPGGLVETSGRLGNSKGGHQWSSCIYNIDAILDYMYMHYFNDIQDIGLNMIYMDVYI